MTAAVRAGDVLFLDEIHHLLVAPAGRIDAGGVFNQLIGAVTGVAVLAVHERIGKAADMSGSNPGRRIHEDSRIQTNVPRGLLNKLLAPRVFYVILEFHTKRTVIPGVGKTSVDFGAAVDKTASLAQGDDFLHRFFGVFHTDSPYGAYGLCARYLAKKT